MTSVSVVRIFVQGWKNFARNYWLSVATVSIMVLTLFTMSSLMVLNFVSRETVRALEEKVDISVYLNNDTSQADAQALRAELAEMDEVKTVDYVDKDQALEEFKAKNKDNVVVSESLDILGFNPLQPLLRVKARETSQYPIIDQAIKQSLLYEKIVDRMSFQRENIQTIIARSNALNKFLSTAGLALTVIFIIIAVLVMFNTIRLTMYSYREEIEIMRLVGAKNNYIRWPFILEGVWYGVFAAVITTILLFPILASVSPFISQFFGTLSASVAFDVFLFYKSNVFLILPIQLLVAIAIGAMSSFIAMRRYLRV